MRLLCFTMVVVLIASSQGGFAQEKLAAIVDAAIKEEVVAFEEVRARFEKGKLKPAESQMFFGKKKLNKEEQRQRLTEIAAKVDQGEVSFRLLSLAIDDIKIGQAGVIGSKFQPIECRSTSDSDQGNEFSGSYRMTSNSLKQVGRSVVPTTESTLSRPFLFRDVPGGEQLLPRKTISIQVPMIVVGRESDTFVLESLAAAVKRVRQKK